MGPDSILRQRAEWRVVLCRGTAGKGYTDPCSADTVCHIKAQCSVERQRAVQEHVQCKDLDFLTVPWQERATWLRCGVLRVQCSSSTVQRRNAVIQRREAEKCTQTPTQHLAQLSSTGRCHDAVERCPMHRGHDPELHRGTVQQ